MENKLSLDFGSNQPKFRRKIMQNIIVDRKSKYTAVAGFVESKEDVKKFMSELLRDKYFQKSTHNTYAFRVTLDNGCVLESKNDDGETWAGNCILRELQRSEFTNTLVVVTRYFGWVHLQADRFKNVIEATKIILDEIK